MLNHSRLRIKVILASLAVSVPAFVLGAIPVGAVTTIGTDIATDGILTINGNVNMNDPSADTLLLGAAADTVTVVGDVSITDTQWSVSSAGALTTAGLITGTAGATISGAAASLNASSNFATNINTGTSSGAVAIGGGSGTVAVDSSVWDISAAGAMTGISAMTLVDLTATGNVTFNDLSADTLLFGQNGATPDTVTIAGDVSITDTQWAVTAAGAANFASLNSTPIGATTASTGAFTTLSSTGVTALGDNSATVAVNSSVWDITALGAASGLTTVNASGAITGGTLTDGTFTVTAGAATGLTSVASPIYTSTGAVAVSVDPGGAATLNLGTTNADLVQIGSSGVSAIDAEGTTVDIHGTGAGSIYTSPADGDLTLGSSLNQVIVDATGWGVTGGGPTNGYAHFGAIDSTPIGATTASTGAFTTLSSTGVTALGDNSATVAVNSSVWDIDTLGAASGFTTVDASGAITGGTLTDGTFSVTGGAITGATGLTLAGGAVSLNLNSNNTTDISTGTSTGAVTIGGGAGTVAVNSTSWDIDTLGAASGFTTVDASGAITGGTLTDGTFSVTGGAITGATGITLAGGAVSLNLNSNNTTDISTGTSTGAVTIGGGAGTVAVDSTSWDIDTLGAATGFTGIVSTGTVDFSGATLLLPGTLTGLTVAGAATSIEDNSNFNTTINTGTSTGSITLGGGAGTVAVNSTSWDIDTLGAASGFTTVDASGAITGGTLTDGTFSVTAGAVTGVTTLAAGTSITVGSGSAIAKIVKGTVADDVAGWVPDGAAVTFTITQDAASVTANSFIGISSDGGDFAGSVCWVSDVAATVSFTIRCAVAPPNAAALRYMIVN